MKGDNFYIIQSGLVKIISEGLKEEKIYGAFDYFGEVALVQNAERSAHVEAVTDLELLALNDIDFCNLFMEQSLVRTCPGWQLYGMQRPGMS